MERLGLPWKGHPVKNRIQIVREYDASVEEVWEMWTTKEGIEAWWGPGGFSVRVRRLELRPEGALDYAMIAEAPEMVAFMKREGMPTTQECKITFKEVDAPRRLAYVCLVDFVPGHPPYDTENTLELTEKNGRTSLTLTIDPMHDEEWTRRATMGWESELGKLEALLAARRGRVTG
jgi:uncharacterized protein YndB with AHSA1/START domain